MIVRQSPMNRVLDRLIEDVSREMNGSAHRSDRSEEAAFTLALDVYETEEGYQVVAALPGINVEDIQVNLDDNVLTISAETRHPEYEDGTRTLLQERRYGRFSRSLRFAVAVDADAIDAQYVDGVLTLDVPKAESVKPRRIQINRA